MADDRTVAQKLFQDRFPVSIQEHYLYSAEFLKVYNPLRREPGEDAVRSLQNTRVMLMTPVAMTMYFSEGASLGFQNYEDIYKVYMLLTEHLRNWNIVAQQAFNTSQAPISDLRQMDAFAASLHPLVIINAPKSIYATDLNNTGLMNFIGSGQQSNTRHLRELRVDSSTRFTQLAPDQMYRPLSESIGRRVVK